MRRLAIRFGIIAATVLMVNSVYAQETTSKKPAVILIKGGFGSIENSSTRQLHDILKPDCKQYSIDIELLDNRPFLFAGFREFEDAALGYKKAGYTHMALVGHSLGGAVAYRIARRLLANGIAVRLVTLDATSVPTHWYREVPGPHIWLNLHSRKPRIYNLIRWGHEQKAYRNFHSYVRHTNAPGLFRPMREWVMGYLGGW